MKRFINFLRVFILCICILFSGMSIPIIVHAEDTVEVEPRMTYISSYSCSLNISESGVASVTGTVRGKSGVSSAYVKCTLQMSVSGDWVDVISWEDSRSDSYATVSETYQLYSHGTYRVSMVCRANTEEKTGTSAYRTY